MKEGNVSAQYDIQSCVLVLINQSLGYVNDIDCSEGCGGDL